MGLGDQRVLGEGPRCELPHTVRVPIRPRHSVTLNFQGSWATELCACLSVCGAGHNARPWETTLNWMHRVPELMALGV